jgi:hypothetical protein
MGKQHNNFAKDRDLLAEAYGKVQKKPKQEVVEEGLLGAVAGGLLGHHLAPGLLAAELGAEGIAGAATGAYLGHKAEDESDKTGHLSDREIVAKAKEMGTAGKEEIEAAEKRLDAGKSLDPEQRKALARDVYGHAEQDIARDRHHNEDAEDEYESRAERADVDKYEYEQGKEAGEHHSADDFSQGDIVEGVDGAEVVVDIHEGVVYTMELAQGGNKYGDDEGSHDFSELTIIARAGEGFEEVEDQETGYEQHMDELGAGEGFTGSGKGHATD